MPSSSDTARVPEDGTTILEQESIAPVSTEGMMQAETTPLLPHDLHKEETIKTKVPYKNIDGKRFWPLVVCILLAYILSYFDSTMMATSHPVITSYFNSSNSASWLSTVFSLANTVSQPVYGRISDTIGRRSVFFFALTLFGITTAWCALAQSIGSFIAARTAAGLAAGGVLGLSNILLSDVVKIEYRGMFQAYLSIAYGFGNSIGAAGGGILCDRLGWRAAFGIQIPFIFALLAVAYFSVPSDLGPNLAAAQGKSAFEALKGFDMAGAVALVVTISGLILGINLGGNVYPWTHPVVIVSLVVFFITMIILVKVERKAERPVLPLGLLSSIPLGNLMWSNFLATCVTNTILFNFPILIQTVWQQSASASGLYLLSPLVGVCVSSALTGIFIKRTRKLKPMMVLGVILLLVGALGVASLSLPGLPKWSVILLNPWTSIAQGFHFPATTVSVLALTQSDDHAVVITTLGLIRNLGSVIGVAISSLIFQNLLLIYLERNVEADAPTKRRIIETVRKSIKAIGKLPVSYKISVLAAYAQALQITFLAAASLAIIVICLILPLRIPPLREDEDTGSRNKLNSNQSEANDSG